MKKLSDVKKLKVINTFLAGYSYDEIAAKSSIAKGSVVNIINAFRSGELPIIPNEYIDALRELAVDIRKQQVSVKQLKMYTKINGKLAEIGVGVEEVEQWLDIAADVAAGSAHAQQFVPAALDLAELEASTGKDPRSLTTELKAKSEDLKTLQAEIAQALENKKKAVAELAAVKQAVAQAQQQYDGQVTGLKTKLQQHMAENQISWGKVNTTMAVLKGELAKKKLGEDEIKYVSQLIAEAGSLVSSIKGLKEEKACLEEQVLGLKEEFHNLEMAKTGSEKLVSQLASQVFAMRDERKTMGRQLEENRMQLAELKAVKYRHAQDIYTAWLLLAFLEGQDLADSDFDWLVEIMNGIRLVRLGKKPKQVFDAQGKLLCQCHVPVPYTPLADYGLAIKKARERLAGYIAPLVSDKFVPVFEYEVARLKQEVAEISKELSNALSGHPTAYSQQAGQPKALEQKMAEEETNTAGQYDKAAPPQADIAEGSTLPQGVPGDLSPEKIKAKMEMEKKFLASL